MCHLKLIRHAIGAMAFMGVFTCASFAGSPTVRVDFDMYGRSVDQVNEPGYNSWTVTETASTSNTYSGVTFTFAKYGTNGSGIKTDWYKSGVVDLAQRLTQDGLIVVDGNSGGAIELTLSGLSTGSHSILAYHNSTNGYDWASVNVYVDGSLKQSNVQPTNRQGDPTQSAYSYVTFHATAGQSVTIRWVANTSSSSSYKNVVINGFALNVSDPSKQAVSPTPVSNDFHVDADGGSTTLQWTKASGAVNSYVIMGTDSNTVATANRAQAIYRGTESSYLVSGLSHQYYYYWRVDQEDASGNITPGEIWKFAPRRLAFPGAEGYGRHARGGRGGVVVHVTNLNDAGAGSLREAVENDIGPRTIVFDVAGIITLKSRLTLSSSYVTVAGQTAPGKGIVIRGAPFGFSGVKDGIMRFMRIRLGAGQTFDGTGLQGSDYCIFDHNSISWTIDESFSSRSGKNITLQKTLIAEALNAAGHQNYPAGTKHGYAATIGGEIGSFHHNLLAHNEGRNWSLGGGLDGNGYYSGRLDIFNNVVYNWGGRATDGGAHQVNFVNNYYKEGAATNLSMMLTAEIEGTGKGSQAYYVAGNILQAKDGSITCDGSNHSCGRRYRLSGGQVLDWDVWNSTPFFPSYATIHSAQHAYKIVLSDVGATMPVWDDHDIRMVKETINGTTTTKGSVTGLPGLIDHQNDAGGYESYPSETRPSSWDADGDGMPAWFETYIGTSPHGSGFNDANGDSDENGYTNLEDYLHFMATFHQMMDVNTSIDITLSDLFAGFTSNLSYSVNSNGCINPSISSGILTLNPTSKCGLNYLDITVTDGQGSRYTRQVGVFVNGSTRSSQNKAPYFITGDSLSVIENQAEIATIQAIDPENAPLTWSIGTGSDSEFFEINAQTGLLRFIAPPNYENPLDAGFNNVYWVYIRVSDGENTTEQKTAIWVEDVLDDEKTLHGFSTLGSKVILKEGAQWVQVYNVNGKIQFTKKLNNINHQSSFELDFNQLSIGPYFILVFDANGSLLQRDVFFLKSEEHLHPIWLVVN